MHKIEFTLEDDVYILTCPDCSYEKRYYKNENRLDIINTGDSNALHAGGLFSPDNDRLKPFEEYFND